jgi:hypothetical protein
VLLEGILGGMQRAAKVSRGGWRYDRYCWKWVDMGSGYKGLSVGRGLICSSFFLDLGLGWACGNFMFPFFCAGKYELELDLISHVVLDRFTKIL